MGRGPVKVSKNKYSWGRMMHVEQGASRTFPLHPEHQEAIAKLKHGESAEFEDEQRKLVKAERIGDKVHLSNVDPYDRRAKDSEPAVIDHSEFDDVLPAKESESEKPAEEKGAYERGEKGVKTGQAGAYGRAMRRIAERETTQQRSALSKLQQAKQSGAERVRQESRDTLKAAHAEAVEKAKSGSPMQREEAERKAAFLGKKVAALAKREAKEQQAGPLQTGRRGGQYYETEGGKRVYVGKK